MAKGWQKALGVFVAIVAVALFVNANPELFNKASVSDGTPQLGTGTDPNAGTIQTYSGLLTIRNNVYDSLDSALEYGDDTETTTIYYTRTADGSWIRQSGTTSSTLPATASVQIDPTIKSLWAEVSIKSGQAFYVDANKAVSTNSRVAKPIWADADRNNRNTYIFPLDVTGYKADPNNNPTQTWGVPLIKEGSLDLDDPTNQLAIGTGKVKCQIDWVTSMDADARGEAVSALIFTMNDTDDSKWFALDSYITFPAKSGTGFEKIFLSQMKASKLASTYEYRYDYGADVDGANMITIQKTDSKKINTPFVVYTNLDTTNKGISVTAEVKTVNAQGAYTSNTDVVKCVA